MIEPLVSHYLHYSNEYTTSRDDGFFFFFVNVTMHRDGTNLLINKELGVMTHIQYLVGDLLDSNAQVIVNPVNCKGVMGKGLALAFKERYPEMFRVYQKECSEGRLRISRPTLYKKSTPWILNFPTKDDWRAKSKLEYIEQGLHYFVEHYKEAGINSIAFPKLGVQNGKLSWDDVGPLMMKYLKQVDIPVYIYIAEGDNTYQISDEGEV